MWGGAAARCAYVNTHTHACAPAQMPICFLRGTPLVYYKEEDTSSKAEVSHKKIHFLNHLFHIRIDFFAVMSYCISLTV